MKKPDATMIRFEDNAHVVSVTGWACKKCGCFFGDPSRDQSAERMARWCCATDLPCETDGCAGRVGKPYRFCQACQDRQSEERWQSVQCAEWDGEFPVCAWDSDQMFWSEEDLHEYMMDVNAGEPILKLVDLRLCICEKVQIRQFEVMDFLCDDIHEDTSSHDFRADLREIEKTVNDWLEANTPAMYQATNKAISLESLMGHVSEPEDDR